MPLDNNSGPAFGCKSYMNKALKRHLDKLKIAHQNCQSIKSSSGYSKFDELKSIISGSLLDVFAMTETWLKPYISSRSLNMPGYKLCRNDRLNCRGGGVGIYISNKLSFKVVFQASEIGSCESLFVELHSNGSKLLFGVVYLPYGDLVSFENFHNELLLRYSNIIIVGDFNYNMFDVIKSSNMRALCLRNNLSVYHNSKPSHIDVVHGSSSLIDYWLLSDSSMVCVSDQMQCELISHHAFIFAAFTVSIDRRLDEFIEYRDFNSINWEGITSVMSDFDYACFHSANVDGKCSYILSLLNSMLCFVPIVRRKIVLENNGWFNCKEIVYAKSLCSLAYRSFIACRSDSNWKIFCKYRNKAKSVVRKIKRRYYSRLFSGLDTKNMWKVLRGSGCINEESIAFDSDVNLLNEYFVGNDDVTHCEDPFLGIYNNPSISFSFQCVNELDVINALAKVNSKSSGIDNISIRFVKLIFPHVYHLIVELFNQILTTSIFPECWKIARVVPIPKSKVIRGPEDLRPISILPALSKILEHILKEQMLVSTLSKIYDRQYAFRKGYNTTSMLLSVTDHIRSNINENMLSVLISLDLSKAFNSICHCTLIKKLREYFNFSTSACRLILSYLSGRSQFVEYNGNNSSLRSISTGVPQGSVLGPLLFMLYINDLPRVSNSSMCDSFIFADDVFLLFRNAIDFSDVLQNNINFCLKRVLEWTSCNSLTINPSKTKAMMFGPTSRFFLELDLYLGNTHLEFVDHIKCLGVTLDSKLLFDHHIDIIHWKVSGILRKIYSTNLYLPERIKYNLAHSLMFSQILYCIEVFSGTSSTIFRKINRVVNMVIRFVYNVKRHEHISEYVKLFLGLKFDDFVKYRNLFLFHKVIKSNKPITLCKSFTFSRSSRNPQVSIPRIYSSLLEKSFLVRIARLWNVLPYSLRIFSHSNNVFRRKLIEHLSNSTR